MKKKDSKDVAEDRSPVQEDNKSGDGSSNNEGAATNSEKAASLSSFLKTEKDCSDEVLGGICTAWFLKCPPIDGNSHFENLQSTNWNSLRFKNPPTEDSEIGWRVEFRPMDIQLTDFENSALTIAVGMIANVINTFDTNFILPVSLIDENMKRAHNREGLLNTKFWWKMPAVGKTSSNCEAPLRESGFVKSDQEESTAANPEEDQARD